ncbi:hypothetical protein [Saccharomonospora halophila]|uniref:hypothetical protein n=1 Tax=Saccharomonospora halophila TaxID=129922 RepID=UPI00036E10E6|nr:hypothetical protein [Saccharomonospora halophila]
MTRETLDRAGPSGGTQDVVPDPATSAQGSAGAVSPRAAGWALLGVTMLLNVVSMAVPALIDHPLTTNRGEIQNYLDVFVEGNLPTWWSTGLLVVGAVLYGVVAFVARSAPGRDTWAWVCGAVLLGLMSLDDHTQLHERLDRIGREVATFDGFPFYWLIPGILAGGVVAAGMVYLGLRLRGRTRAGVLGGCALLLWSALGMEAVQGLWIATGESGPLYVLTYHAEELGENLGVLLMMAAAVWALRIERRDGATVLRYRGAGR